MATSTTCPAPLGSSRIAAADHVDRGSANIFTDLRSDPPAHPPIAHARTTLICGKPEAHERLCRIADLGFDDALMIVPFGVPEILDEIHDLLP